MYSQACQRFTQALLCLLASACCAAAHAGQGVDGAPPRTAVEKSAKCSDGARALAPRVALEGRLAGAASHCYSLALTRGQFALTVLEQRGVDVEVTVYGPDGVELFRVDNQNATHGPEAVSLVAAYAGTYLLRVRKLIKGSVNGGYVIELRESRDATAADHERVAADRALMEGQALLERGDAAPGRALEKFDHAARVYKAAGDTYYEAFALYLSGLALTFERKSEALETLGRALPLFKAAGDLSGYAATLQEMGEVYLLLGRNDEALESQEKALALARQSGNDVVSAEALLTLGYLNYSMGATRQGLRRYEEAWRIWNRVKYPRKQATTAMRVAEVSLQEGSPVRALALYDQAFSLFSKLKDTRGVASAYVGMAWAHVIENELEEAFRLLNMALALARKKGDRFGEAAVLANLGRVYQDSGDSRRALNALVKALAISRELNDRRQEAYILETMMFAFKSRGERDKAILYGKQAVNIYQDIRENSQTLEAGLQKSFLKEKEDIYRSLADLLITGGRLQEARRVLEMLKENEYFEYLRRQSESGPRAIRTGLTGKERAMEEDEQSPVKIEKAIRELEAVERKTDEQTELLDRLRDKRREAGKRLSHEISSARADGGPESPGRPQPAPDAGAEPLNLGPGVVRLYTMKSRKKYIVMLFTSDAEDAGSSEIGEKELNQKIWKFRDALQDPKSTEKSFLPLAQELYKIIVRPVEKSLRDAKAKTLLWTLDGVLRHLPVAALHDGEKYLAERYRSVVLTPVTLTRQAGPQSPSQRLALGLGVTKPLGIYPALPAVGEELAAIIRRPGDLNARGILPGEVLLNEQFTEDAMLRLLAQRYTVVHIASHFEFQPAENERPYLLLGDGTHLTVGHLFSGSRKLFQGVELLTLSACNTASGEDDTDGLALESFGSRAQEEGAHTVIATLWSVADQSTSRFMREFYRLLNDDPEMSKAEALRLAQLSLLNERAAAAGGDGRGPYAHPYFWAPFVMIGDWR